MDDAARGEERKSEIMGGVGVQMNELLAKSLQNRCWYRLSWCYTGRLGGGEWLCLLLDESTEIVELRAELAEL